MSKKVTSLTGRIWNIQHTENVSTDTILDVLLNNRNIKSNQDFFNISMKIPCQIHMFLSICKKQ